jgi:hypothetical protein
MGHIIIFYCLRFETPPTWRVRSPYLYPPGICYPVMPPGSGFIFVASYESQGYGGGIRPRLHTGFPPRYLEPSWKWFRTSCGEHTHIWVELEVQHGIVCVRELSCLPSVGDVGQALCADSPRSRTVLPVSVELCVPPALAGEGIAPHTQGLSLWQMLPRGA